MMKISASMRQSLRAYYGRSDAVVDAAAKAQVVQLVAELAAAQPAIEPERPTPLWRFVAGQLRFVNPLAWVVQVVLLVMMLLVVGSARGDVSTMPTVMIAAVLSVAIASPSVFKSFEDEVSELEASCRHDSAQVLVSRLVLFGLADVLWMTLAALIVPAIASGDPFMIFLYAATPFFAFCALCLYISRVTNGRCVKACIIAASCVIAGIWASIELFPHWYSDTSMMVWTIALIVACALAIIEARMLVTQVALNSAQRQAPLVRI